MSGSTKTSIKLPQVKMPRVARGSRNPPGWGSTEVSIRGRGFPGAAQFRPIEPAGDPPPEWTGTRPEWAIWWGLTKTGLQPGLDFTYLARLPGVGSGYYSTIDFLVPSYGIGIEVQGKYWHYGQGSDKIFKDMFRVNAFAGQGIKVIFIDEPDALTDPIYFVREALQGNDHSHVQTGRIN